MIFWHSYSPYINEISDSNLIPSILLNTVTNNTNLVFMLISGYFGIHLHLEKLIKLDLEIIFYDVVYLFLFGAIGIKAIIFAFMPLTFKSHWFITYYFVIALLSGFLNMIPEKLPRKSFRNLLLLLIFFFYALPTIFYKEIIEDTGKGVVCMAIMYLVGRYIRLYHGETSFRKSRLALLFTGTTLLIVVLNFTMCKINGIYMGPYCRDNSFFILITAVSLFLLFREMPFCSSVVNHLSVNAVILYCIEGYVRSIFNRFIDLSPYTDSLMFNGIVFVYAVAVFTTCIVINEIRRLLFNKADSALAAFLMRGVNALTPAATRGYDKIHSIACSFLGKTE